MFPRLTPEFRMINEPAPPCTHQDANPLGLNSALYRSRGRRRDNSGTGIINCAAKKGLGSVGVCPSDEISAVVFHDSFAAYSVVDLAYSARARDLRRDFTSEGTNARSLSLRSIAYRVASF